MKRREFLLRTAGAGAILANSLPPLAVAAPAIGSTSGSAPAAPKVVVVGGGYGGATAAKYIRLWSGGQVDVTLVEPNPRFVSCPLSNLVLGGSRTIDDLTMDYRGLERHGVRIIRDRVASIDPARRAGYDPGHRPSAVPATGPR